MSYYSNLRNEIDELLPEKINTLLDIGCGTGVTSDWIKKKFDCNTIGVELISDAAKQAETILDKVYQLNIEDDLTIFENHANEIDTILMLDVLEHIRDPWTCLERSKSLLTENGVVIASIPNVRNLKALGPLLLSGDWAYQDGGILDRTHLRFFTKKTIQEMFNNAGFQIEEMITTGPTHRHKIKSKSGILMYALNLIFFGKLEGFIAHQYIVRASISASIDEK